ncbi:MAG TPA: primosomal protein N' [candidate division Zixibacteria bacterium]|jgi:primosomal protein N' (replication factor Y)
MNPRLASTDGADPTGASPSPRARAAVAVDVAFKRRVRREFSYRVPDHWPDVPQPGELVVAPLGGSDAVGIIVAADTIENRNEVLKSLRHPIDSGWTIPPDVLALCRYVAAYYRCSLGEALAVAAAPMMSDAVETCRMIRPDWNDVPAQAPRLTATEQRILRHLPSDRDTPVTTLARGMTRSGRWRLTLHRLAERGLVSLRWQTKRPPIPGDAIFFGRHPAFTGELPAELEPLLQSGTTFREAVTARAMTRRLSRGATQLCELLEQDALDWHPVSDRHAEQCVGAEPEYDKLNDEQRRVLEEFDAIRGDRASPIALLWGPTGSGKTAVYCEAIRRTWAGGQNVLFLVPEIVLAGQLIGRLQESLKERIAVWHSGLSSAERYWMARLVARGRYRMVVGARSAVYAPMPNLGLIIVDEEHAESYKQSDPAPRYHARDLAVQRARLTGAICLLGSATPSLETIHKSNEREYRLLRLTQRVGHGVLPTVRIVDLRSAERFGDERWVSPTLKSAIEETLRSGRQAIIFLNRRGHSTSVACRACGQPVRCPSCDLALTYHARDRSMRCHVCSHVMKAPDHCPACNGAEFNLRGAGTQKIELLLASLDAPVRIERLDADIAARRGTAAGILRRFASGECNLLVGTQMVTKGLDVGKVDLIGVIWAEQQMSLPDFRAEERTFQLLTQVAGRAGRRADAEPGRVIVQSFCPDNDLLAIAARQDPQEFFARELPRRRALRYPPYGHLVLCVFSATEPQRSLTAAKGLTEFWKNAGADTGAGAVYGPAPALFAKRGRIYFHNVLIKTDSIPATHERLDQYESESTASLRRNHINWQVDVDPVDFF